MDNKIQVAKPGSITSVKALMENPSIKARFNEILGSKATKFMSTVISISNSAALAGANPQTIMNAAVVAATLDLEVNQNLGFAYIVPYVNKGVKEAQFQMGWRGYFQLAMRTGKYKKITTNEVYEGEVTVKNRFKEEYEFGEKISDKVVGFLAYYELLNGGEKYVYMSADEMEKHAKKYSQSYRNDKYNSSQWSQNFIEMGKKTVLKRLLNKYAELSTEQVIAQKFDQAVISKNEDLTFSNDIELADADYVDNQPEEAVIIEQQANPADTIKAKMAAAGENFNQAKPKEELF